MKSNLIDKLSLDNQRLLSCGLFALMMGISLRIAFGSDLAFKTADTQLILSDSADRLATLAQELDSQAEVIRQKDQAYEELTKVYQHSLKEAEGYERLKAKIERIDSLPEVQDLDVIQSEISDTEDSFQDFISK